MVENAELKIINESVFWEEGVSPYGAGVGGQSLGKTADHVLDMGTDSYIWCFSGGRGAGKSTLMVYFALKSYWLYGFRIVSNFNIECYFQRQGKPPELVKSEPLDFYKLFCFENDYDNCLILIDEAPDIISHMASMTWKNRLLNIFVRQLRKNHNNLFMGAQQFELIDKSMRWQTDIEVECADASRKYGWGKQYRGMCILARMIDNSGMWTGIPYEEAVRRERKKAYFEDPAEKVEIYPRFLWEKDGRKAVFDSYEEFDVWESLRKVDISLQAYNVGDTSKEPLLNYQKAAPVLERAMNQGKNIVKRELYDTLDIPRNKRASLGTALMASGARTYGSAGTKLDMTDFSMDIFKDLIGVETE